ncbi:DUF2939 domain-containing protein [Phenylobacterium sp.]|jgi:hypothetical protein|uniref:DUF2939 domain-containing protein n=1 Tax=Phenylobacterium sp. TaxID=1871053 RepID=UPI002F924332
MRAILIAVLALLLSACASAKRLDAANDVHALLLSIRDNDQATFDRHVDRGALKQVIQAKLETEAVKDKRLSGIAAVLAPSLAEFAGEALVQPRTFKMVAEQYGYNEQTKIPGPVAIASALKTLPDGRVCATKTKDGPCVLIFTNVEGTWKLSGFEGDLSMLRLKL